MVKNWVMLGDEAFKDDESPMGTIRLKKDEMDNWAEHALEQLRKAAKSSKVQEMVKGKKVIVFDALFYKKVKVDEDMKKRLIESATAMFDGIVTGLFTYKTSTHRGDNMIFVDFYMSKDEAKKFSFCDDVPTLPVQDINGEWKEIDYRKIKAKFVGDHCQVTLDQNTYQFDETLKIPYSNNVECTPDLDWEITYLIKSSWVWLRVNSDNTVSIISDEDVILSSLSIGSSIDLRKSLEDIKAEISRVEKFYISHASYYRCRDFLKFVDSEIVEKYAELYEYYNPKKRTWGPIFDS